MGEDSDRFRKRALECREVAERARTPEARDALLRVADDLEAEADRIDAEEARVPSMPGPTQYN